MANASNIDIKYHRFRWSINPSASFIRGAVFTRFKMVGQPANVLEFDLADVLTVDSVRYHNTRIIATRPGQDIVRITLPAGIPAGTLDTIEVFYKGNPPQGFGFGSFIQDSHNGSPIVWTLSEPYGAKDWWPCKQDLADKIDSIDTFVNIPNGNRAAGNGKLISVTALAGSRQLYHWKHRYPISAYLVATAITNYTDYSFKVALSTDSLLMQNYFYPEYAAGFRPQVQAIKGLLQLYDSLIGPYPFMGEKYGHAQFNWGGGMEHQTMSFMTNMNFNLQAHELVHQWFGDKVTTGSWRDLWLNEGFATYFASVAGQFLGVANEWNDFRNSGYPIVSSEPDGSVFVDDTTDVGRIFDGRLTYTKGAWLLHMLRYRMGDSAFFAGIRNYIADPALAYNFARTPDLKRHLEAASGQNLTEFFNDWLYGEGLPSYMITWRQNVSDSVAITFDQSQSHASVSFFESPVPLRITYRNGSSETVSVNNTEDMQTLHVRTNGIISRIDFDPEKWLLASGAVTGLVSTVPEIYKAEVKAYPNPANRSFSVDGVGNNVIISLLDLSGKQLHVYPAGKPSFLPIAPQLPTGIYSLQISSPEGKIRVPLSIVR